MFAPTDDIAQIFNVTKVIVACEGEIRRILSDEESKRYVSGMTNSETPNTIYYTCYRFTLKYKTSLALTAYGIGNGSNTGKSSTSTGNVIVATVDTSNYNQLWMLESTLVNNEEDYYAEVPPTYPFGNNSSINDISSGYGQRTGGFHIGIDMPANSETPLYSMYSGTVVEVGDNVNDTRGYYVIIDASRNVQGTTYPLRIVYMHLCECATTTNSAIQQNASVSAGTLIGKVGNTGSSQGNHLHLSVIIDGSSTICQIYNTMNPMALFSNRTFNFTY